MPTDFQILKDAYDTKCIRVAELEEAILDWHREDRDDVDQERATMKLYNVAEAIRKAKGLDLGYND